MPGRGDVEEARAPAVSATEAGEATPTATGDAASVKLVRGQQAGNSSDKQRRNLTAYQREILGRLLQLASQGKLSNHDIRFVMGVAERTVQRYRAMLSSTGSIEARPKPLNAEKMHQEQLDVRPHCLAFDCSNSWRVIDKTVAMLQELVDWVRANDDAMMEDMQAYLLQRFNLKVSAATLSRRLRRVGVNRAHGARRRVKLRKEALAGQSPAPRPIPVSAPVTYTAIRPPPQQTPVPVPMPINSYTSAALMPPPPRPTSAIPQHSNPSGPSLEQQTRK
jgi:hypothetical protein